MIFAHDSFAFSLIDFKSPPYASPHSPISFFNYVIVYGLSRISSPFLGFLSGYFAAANLAERTYQRVALTRLKTLYFPALFWSFIFFAVTVVAGYAVSNHAVVRERIATVDLNDFLGITKFPLNYPLHYLIALFKCVLISPVLIYLLRRLGPIAFTALACLAFLALTGSDLNPYVPGQHAHDIWPRADLFLFFSLGLLAQRRWVLDIGEALMKCRISNPVALFGIALIFLVSTFNWPWLVQSATPAHVWCGAFVLLVARIAGALLLLALLPGLRHMAQRGLYVSDKLTFLLFCTHIISYFIFDGIIRVEHLSAYGVLEFYIVPFFDLAVAAIVLVLRNCLYSALHQLRHAHGAA
jgi:succinoglycan biosynthesis protein ExoH